MAASNVNYPTTAVLRPDVAVFQCREIASILPLRPIAVVHFVRADRAILAIAPNRLRIAADFALLLVL
jgi:hypothetical protein